MSAKKTAQTVLQRESGWHGQIGKSQKKDLGGQRKLPNVITKKNNMTNYYASTLKNNAPNGNAERNPRNLAAHVFHNAEPRHNASPEEEGVEASPQPPPQL